MDIEKNQTWEDVTKRVVESFNSDAPAEKYAIERWLKENNAVRDLYRGGRVIHSFSSPEVLNTAVEFFQAEIRKNIGIYTLQITKNECERKKMEIRDKLGKFQGVFPDDDNDEHVIPEVLGVVRMTEDDKKKKIYGDVIKASVTLARNNGNKDNEQPLWPAGVGRDFANDLTDFINVNGDDACKLIEQICQDLGFAKRVCDDEDYPKPIRFLAMAALEVYKTKCLPAKEQTSGFGFGAKETERR